MVPYLGFLALPLNHPIYSLLGALLCSVTQWRQILCDPMDCSPPGSSVHGILQARILERVQFSSVAQSCLTLCDPMNCSPPGSSVHGILQAGILEWIATPFSRGSSQRGIKPRPPTLKVNSLPAKLQGKPKNTRVDSLSLL